MNLFICMALLPLLSTAIAIVDKKQICTRIAIPILSWMQVILIAFFCLPVWNGTEKTLTYCGDFSLDRIASYFLFLTNIIAAFSFTHTVAFFKREAQLKHGPEPDQARLYYTASALFVCAMSYVFVCENLGYLWICIEATTLFSAALVYYTREKHALEATWKYLVVCSLGIAFALLGTVFIFASSQYGVPNGGSLNLRVLSEHAGLLQPKLLQLGYIFCLLGYGTKAGVFPLHGWLPDAHSEAPAPASAMLSGALLNCALFAICRITDLVKTTCHQDLATTMPLIWGCITTVAAALLLVHQSGLKRLWAYSSIENVGIMLVAIGLGSHALFFLQALNHSVAKVALFLLSGNIIQEHGTKDLSKIRGVLKSAPMAGALFAVAAIAVTGTPPFGAFVSEWLMLCESATKDKWPVAIALVLALAISFVAICIHVGKILMGAPKHFPGTSEYATALNTNLLARNIVPAILCICALLLGVTSAPQFLVNFL